MKVSKCCWNVAIQALHTECYKEEQEPEIRATTHLRPNYTGFPFSGSCVNKSIIFCRALGFSSGFSSALSSEMSAHKYSKTGQWTCVKVCETVFVCFESIASNI